LVANSNLLRCPDLPVTALFPSELLAPSQFPTIFAALVHQRGCRCCLLGKTLPAFIAPCRKPAARMRSSRPSRRSSGRNRPLPMRQAYAFWLRSVRLSRRGCSSAASSSLLERLTRPHGIGKKRDKEASRRRLPLYAQTDEGTLTAACPDRHAIGSNSNQLGLCLAGGCDRIEGGHDDKSFGTLCENAPRKLKNRHFFTEAAASMQRISVSI